MHHGFKPIGVIVYVCVCKIKPIHHKSKFIRIDVPTQRS